MPNYRPYLNPNCAYCGSLADQRDHVVPKSHNVRVTRNRRKRNNTGAVVSCCFECNSLLSNRNLTTIKDRAEFLLRSYERRWKKFMRLPDMDEYDLDGMSDRLLAFCSVDHKSECIARLEHLKTVVSR